MLGRVLAWLTATLIAISVSCAGIGHDRSEGPAIDQNGIALPALPSGPTLDATQAIPKRTLVEMELVRAASEYHQKSANATLEGSDLLLNPAPGELAWAVFRYEDVAPYYRIDAVQLMTQAGNGFTPSPAFHVGFANYDADRWELSEAPAPNPLNGETYDALMVAAPEGTFYPYSPDGHAYIAVVAYEQPLQIGSAQLLVFESEPPPLGIEATQGTLAGQIGISWVDPAVSFDPDGDRPGVFEYDSIRIARYDEDADEWFIVGEVDPGTTEFIDSAPELLPNQVYRYRLRTLLDGYIGRPSAEVTGRVGVRPVASFTASVNGASVTLDATASHDPDLTDLLVSYDWRASLPEYQGYAYSFSRPDGDPFSFSLADDTKVNRFDLSVIDNEGLESKPAGYYLWSPNDGCVQDDPDQPDPNVFGGGPGTFSVELNFVIVCGAPDYRILFDSDFTGYFGNSNGINVVLLKPYGSPPNDDGPYSFVANIPAAQQNGEYYFAIQVTDGNGDESVYMWPDKVSLGP